jgi:hypothetical protein
MDTLMVLRGSRDSPVWLDGRGVGVKSPGNVKIFLSTSSKPALEPTPPRIQCVPGALFPE